MTNQQTPETLRPIARYKIGYATDDWGIRSSTPSGIPDQAGAWVRYEDHVAAMIEAQQPAPVRDYPPLPRVGPIGYASVVDIDSYVTRLTIGPRLAGVRDVALWTTDQMRAYADRAARAPADSVTAPAGGAEEVDKALNDYAQAFMARATVWTLAALLAITWLLWKLVREIVGWPTIIKALRMYRKQGANHD